MNNTYSTKSRKNGGRLLAKDYTEDHSICGKISAAAAKHDVFCEARSTPNGLIITANSYIDYLIAKSIAVNKFGCDRSSISRAIPGL